MYLSEYLAFTSEMKLNGNKGCTFAILLQKNRALSAIGILVWTGKIDNDPGVVADRSGLPKIAFFVKLRESDNDDV